MNNHYRAGYRDGFQDGIRHAQQHKPATRKPARSKPLTLNGHRLRVLQHIADWEPAQPSDMDQLIRDGHMKRWDPRVSELRTLGYLEPTGPPYTLTPAGQQALEAAHQDRP